jgi:hypothetical protein
MYVIVGANDTVFSLARKYLGSAELAEAIIAANRLDPPYITNDPNFQASAPATGSVQFTLTGTGPVTIPAGTIVQTSSSTPSGQVRSYSTGSSVTLQTTGNTATVSVTCTEPGPLGNVAPGRVTVVVGVSGVSVTNPSPITGGYYLHVLKPGDRVWIPEPNDLSLVAPSPSERIPLSMSDQDGGVGIYISPTGGFEWGTDDLRSVSGPEAIGVEVAARIRTVAGSIFYDRAAGGYVPALVGHNSQDVLAQIALLAQEAALQDDRVADATFVVQQQEISPGWVVVEGTVTLKTGTATAPVVAAIAPSAGGA